MRRALSFPLAVGVVVALCAALAGCAGSSAAPAASTASTTAGELDAAWLDDGRMIGLVTVGSSTCIPSATDVALTGGVLRVALGDPDPAIACTSDLVPRASLVTAPAGIEPAADLQIAVTGAAVGTTELTGVAGLGGGRTEYLPSAGWTDADGQFVILTWGSSSCRPVVHDVAPTAPAEVTVTFTAPPADQVCTLDMAPRATVATVTGLQLDENVSLVLTGDGFDGVRIPISGVN